MTRAEGQQNRTRLEGPQFLWPVRVYYEDTDSAGVVYHANYLRFMERARTEWLRSRGFEQDRLLIECSVIFAVRELRVHFQKPARFNDALLVSAQVAKQGRASFVFQQRVYRDDPKRPVLCSGEVDIVCLDSQRFRPCPLPPVLVKELLG